MNLNDFKKMPRVPDRVDLSFNSGYMQAVRILSEIKRNEKEISKMMMQKL